MAAHGSDALGGFGPLAIAVVLILAVLVGVGVRYGWRGLLTVVAAAVGGGIAFAVGMQGFIAVAAAALAAALPLVLTIRAARRRRAVGAGGQVVAAAVPAAAAVRAPMPAPAARAGASLGGLDAGAATGPLLAPAPAVLPGMPPAAGSGSSPGLAGASPAAPVAAMDVAETPAGSPAGPAIVQARTGKGWVRAVSFAVAGVVIAAMIAGAILSNPSADAEGTRLALGMAIGMLLMFEGLALVFVQHARSGVVVDRTAGTVTVRRGKGWSMRRTVLPLSGVAAVELGDHERRVMAAKHGLGAVIELARYIVAPKRETVYEIFVVPSAGGPRVIVSPFAEKDVFALLPLAEHLARSIGCPLRAPFNPSLVPPGLAPAGTSGPGAGAVGAARPVAA